MSVQTDRDRNSMPGAYKAHPPSAKQLILSLLSAPQLKTMSIGQLIAASALFGIDAPNVRVAVGRLVKQQLLVAPGRGTYAMGPAGLVLAESAREWQFVEMRLGHWDGDWLLIHTAHLGRSNKTQLRQRERALRLNGFVEYQQGLWCRPANFQETSQETRERLLKLGLEASAVFTRVSEWPGVTETALFSLWPSDKLEAAYSAQLALMERSRAALSGMDTSTAARETLMVGEAAIRLINSDPLLPDAIMDGDLRRVLIRSMQEYDSIGRRAWSDFLQIP